MQSQSRNYFRQSFENCSNDISLTPFGLVHSNRDSARKASEADDISSREETHPLGLKRKKKDEMQHLFIPYIILYMYFSILLF